MEVHVTSAKKKGTWPEIAPMEILQVCLPSYNVGGVFPTSSIVGIPSLSIHVNGTSYSLLNATYSKA